MAGNSFLLKGWCVSLVSALMALEPKDANRRFVLIGYYPILMFWFVDGYFLWQERPFRKLYDEVRVLKEADVNFSMDTSRVRAKRAWLSTVFSKTLVLLYGTMIGAVLLVMFLVVAG
jgi:hypothetical protein